MPLAAINVPNLVSGVSQQPATLRLPTSCSELINGWPSIVSGLSKRPPAEWIARLTSTAPANAGVYMIDRDGSYKYLVVLDGKGLKVYDFDGTPQTVDFPDGKAYLTQTNDPQNDFRFVTIGDTTFILNRDVTVKEYKYGEIGVNNFTPNGTVDKKSELPSSTTNGHIWYVETEDDYYEYRYYPAVPQKIEWDDVGNWSTAYPLNHTIVDSLPKTAKVGKVVYLRRTRQYGTKTIHHPSNNDNGNGWTETQPVYRTEYLRYEGKEVQAAKPAVSKWVKLSESELSKEVFGRVSPNGRATVHVTQSIANTYYTVYINGSKKAEYLTPKGVDANTSVPGTDQIAEQLRVGLAGAGYSVTRYGSTLSIKDLPGGTTVMGTAGQGDKAIKAYTTAVNQFSDLPPNEVPGRIVKIKGNLKENGDDYYVLFNDGVWTETFGWNAGSSPLNRTMPHVLIREADGTWTFKEWKWEGRMVGDRDSNPNPSFINCKLNDIFMYSNRLGFIADENVILSEADNFENFYRTTVATLVDSDPIDIAVLNTGNDTLYHALPFNKDLLLMSDRNQYRFSYQNYLGPKNIQVQFTTSFHVSRDVHPVNMGGSVYFVDDKPSYQYAKLWEYFPKENMQGDDAEDCTAPVPEYVTNNVQWMAASARMKAILLYSSDRPNTLYLYKYYWAGERKVQNAWSKWTFNDCTQIYWGGFSGNYLYLVVGRSDGVHLEKIKMDETVLRKEIPSRILVDRQVQKSKLTMSYNATTEETTIHLPWSTTAMPEIIASLIHPDPEVEVQDFRCPVTKVDGNTVTVPGDITGYTIVTAGIPYTFKYTFSTPYLRQPKNNGEVVVLDGLRLQMRYITLEYHDTAYFKTLLQYPGRDDVWTVFDGKITGSETFVVGTTPFVSGKFRIPIVGNNKDMTFHIVNDAPYNCSFGSAEWLATHVPRAGFRA